VNARVAGAMTGGTSGTDSPGGPSRTSGTGGPGGPSRTSGTDGTGGTGGTGGDNEVDMANTVDAAARLAFEQTVPRGLVHRAAVSEVLVTDAARLSGHRFAVAAQLPRGHALFNDPDVRTHDILALAEAVRQAGTLVAHRYEGVPAGHVFPLRTAEIEVTGPGALRAGPEPGRLVAYVTLTDHERRGGELTGAAVHADIHVDGRPVGRGGGGMYFVPPGSYAAFRPPGYAAGATPPTVVPVAPERVARRDPRNVVVGEPVGPVGGRRSFPVVVDTGHAFFFDHPQDHVPGMLLLEAAGQAARLTVAEELGAAVSRCPVVSLRARFGSYAELGEPVRCAVTAAEPVLPPAGPPRVPVTVTVVQAGAERARITVGIAVPEG
jgi:hypothetical protein